MRTSKTPFFLALFITVVLAFYGHAQYTVKIDKDLDKTGAAAAGGSSLVAGPTGALTINTTPDPDEIDVDTAVLSPLIIPPMTTAGAGHFQLVGNINGQTALTAFTSLLPRCWEMHPLLAPTSMARIVVRNTTAGTLTAQFGIFDSAGVLRLKSATLTDLTGANAAKVFTVASPPTLQGQGYQACIVTNDTAWLIVGAGAGAGTDILNSGATKRVYTIPALGSVDFGTVGVSTAGARTGAAFGIPSIVGTPE